MSISTVVSISSARATSSLATARLQRSELEPDTVTAPDHFDEMSVRTGLAAIALSQFQAHALSVGRAQPELAYVTQDPAIRPPAEAATTDFYA